MDKLRDNSWYAALLISVLLWISAAVIFIIFLLFQEDISKNAIAWAVIIIAPIAIAFVSVFYIRITAQSDVRAMFILSLMLLIVHIPLDYLFMKLYAQELLTELLSWKGVLFYLIFLIIPPITGIVKAERIQF